MSKSVKVKNKIANSLKNYKKIVVWGAGGLANLALNKWIPAEQIEYIVDQNANTNRKVINSFPIESIDKLIEEPPDLVIVCSSAYVEIFEQLKNMELDCEYKYVYELFLIDHDYSK